MVNPGLGELVVMHKKGGIVFGYDFSCLGVTTQVISKNVRRILYQRGNMVFEAKLSHNPNSHSGMWWEAIPYKECVT